MVKHVHYLRLLIRSCGHVFDLHAAQGMAKISANPFHPRSRETERSDPTRRDAPMERVHARGDAHRKETVGIYRMDGKYGIGLGKSN